MAHIGLDQGENLDFDAPLDPERSYLYFHVGSDFELGAGSETEEGQEQQFRLVVPEGKQATLIVDPQEPYIYINGDFEVSYNGELFLLRQVLDPTALPLPFDALPLGQHAALHFSGGLSPDLEKVNLEIGAGYAVDQGIAGKWVNLEATPLSVEGYASLAPDGILLSGLTRSNIQPDYLFEGELQAEAYVPFRGLPQNTFVHLEGSAAIPMAQINVEKVAHINTDKVLTWMEPVDDIVGEWSDAIPPIDWNTEWLAKARSASQQGLGWANNTATDSYQSLVDRFTDSES
jgi:hypothetical protein